MRVKLDQVTHVKVAALRLTADEHPSRSGLDYVSFDHNLRYLPGHYFSLILGKFKQIMWFARQFPQLRIHLLEKQQQKPRRSVSDKIEYSKLYRKYMIAVSQTSENEDFAALDEFLLRFEHELISEKYLKQIIRHHEAKVHLSARNADELFIYYGFELNYAEFDRLYQIIEHRNSGSIRPWFGEVRLAANLPFDGQIDSCLIAADPGYIKLFAPLIRSAIIITDQPYKYTELEEEIISHEDIGFNIFHLITKHLAVFYEFMELLQIIYEPSPNKYRSDPFYMHMVADEILTRLEPEDLLQTNIRELFLEESMEIWQVLSRRDVKQVLQTHYHAPIGLDFFNAHKFESLMTAGLKVINVTGLPQNEKLAITLFFMTLKKFGMIQSTLIHDTMRYLSKLRRFDKIDRLMNIVQLDGNYVVIDHFEKYHMISIPYSHLLLDIGYVHDQKFRELLRLDQSQGIFFADHYHNLTQLVDPIFGQFTGLKPCLPKDFDIDPLYDPRTKDIYTDEQLDHTGLSDKDFINTFDDFTMELTNDLLRTTPVLAAMEEFSPYTKAEIEEILDTTTNINDELEYLDQINHITARNTPEGMHYTINHTGKSRINAILNLINSSLEEMILNFDRTPLMHLLELQMAFMDTSHTKEDRDKMAFIVYHLITKILPDIDHRSPLFYTIAFVDAVLAMPEDDEDMHLELMDALRYLITRVEFYINVKHQEAYENISFAMEEKRMMDEEVDLDEIISDLEDTEEQTTGHTDAVDTEDSMPEQENVDMVTSEEVLTADISSEVEQEDDSPEAELEQMVEEGMRRLDKARQPLESFEEISLVVDKADGPYGSDIISDEPREIVISSSDIAVTDLIYRHPEIGTWMPAGTDIEYQRLFRQQMHRLQSSILSDYLQIQSSTENKVLSLADLFTFLLIEEYYPHDAFYLESLSSPLLTDDLTPLVSQALLREIRPQQYLLNRKLHLKILEPAFAVREDNLIQMVNTVLDDFSRHGLEMKIQNKQRLLSVFDYYGLNELYLHLIALHNTDDIPAEIQLLYGDILLMLQDPGIESEHPVVRYYQSLIRPHSDYSVSEDKDEKSRPGSSGIPTPNIKSNKSSAEEDKETLPNTSDQDSSTFSSKKKSKVLPPKPVIRPAKTESENGSEDTSEEEIPLEKVQSTAESTTVKAYERTQRLSAEHIDEIHKIYQRHVPDGPVVIFREILNHIIRIITSKTMQAEVAVIISTFSRAAAKFNLNTSEIFSSFNYVQQEWNKHRDSQTSLSAMLLENIIEFFSGFSYPVEFVDALIKQMEKVN